MAIVIDDRLAGARSVRKQNLRGVSKSSENFNDDAVPPAPGTGLTASQAAAIESYRRGNPLHPHDLTSGPTTVEDGSGNVKAGMFCHQHGQHSISVTPRGKVTRLAVDPDSRPEGS